MTDQLSRPARSSCSITTGEIRDEPRHDDLDGLYSTLLTNGRRNGTGGGLSPKMVRNVHNMIRKALGDACRKGTLQRNVAVLADPPKPERESIMRVWTTEQLRQFLSEISENRLAPAFVLAAHTGMRRGEVLGVAWRDLDLDASRLSVRQAVVTVEYEVSVTDVKTGTARRSVDLDEYTIQALKDWRVIRESEAALSGASVSEDETIFARPDGTPTHPDFFSQTFERHLASSSLPRIRFHDVSHTHATILLKAGVHVKVVSERLGHASPAFTMTVYQHVIPGMQADAAKKFGAALCGE